MRKVKELFRQPTRKQLAITLKDRVIGDEGSIRQGMTGTVVGEWGGWIACKQCFAMEGECSHQQPKKPNTVSGKGIVEVKFDVDGEITPVNCVWLQPV